MPRLLSQVLEHLGFPEEPRIERRIRCPQFPEQQDQEEVPDEIAEDPPRGDDPVSEVEVEVERSLVPDSSPPSPPPPPSAPALAATTGPFIYSAAVSGACSCQFEGARCCYGCCLFTSYYTSIAGPEVGPSRGHYRA